MPNTEDLGPGTAHMPFGRFFGRLAEQQDLAGFRLARFTPNVPKRAVQRHHHEEAHFVFVLAGTYESRARPARDGAKPRVIYSPPGTTHRDCFADEDLSRAAFATLSVSATTRAGFESTTKLPDEEVCLPDSAVGLVRQILSEARGLDGAGPVDDLSECITEALCLELLLRSAAGHDEAGAPAWLGRARELLRDTWLDGGPRSVGAIAAAIGVHPVHLARRFRHHFGQTPGEYLRQCRLERARWLLSKSSVGLAEIAMAAGFSDQSHFTHAFRKGFGASPGAFRRN
jgi:AraC family transcriptional regulator